MNTRTPHDILERLDLLQMERALALDCELRDDAAYMADLEGEITAMHAAWITAAVTEIAILRADLSGPLLG